MADYGWDADIDLRRDGGHDMLVDELPFGLIEALASVEEQRRYIIGATVDEYLTLPSSSAPVTPISVSGSLLGSNLSNRL